MEGKGTGDLLSEVGSRVGGGDGNEEGHVGDVEDPAAPKFDNAEGVISKTEKETAPGARGENTQQSGSCSGPGCLGLVPHF